MRLTRRDMALEGLVAQRIHDKLTCRQIAAMFDVSPTYVSLVKQRVVYKEAVCPICRLPWKIKGNRNPSPAVGAHIEKKGCSDCLVRGLTRQ